MSIQDDKKQRKNAAQKARRLADGNADTKKYEKTFNGFLMRTYRNMKSRVKGITNKAYLWQGKTLIDKDQFYVWCHSHDGLKQLFKAWQDSGYNRRLTPSVDRIDSRLGYVFENMEWVPFYVNCSRGGKSGH